MDDGNGAQHSLKAQIRISGAPLANENVTNQAGRFACSFTMFHK